MAKEKVVAESVEAPKITADKEQLQKLFSRLDKNKDGQIDFKELQEYYIYLNQHDNTKDSDAHRLFDSISTSASNSSINFNFKDFLEYVSEKDKKIRIFFDNLDRDKNGIIDKAEIQKGFADFGIVLNNEQIDKLLRDLDSNGSLEIDWKEWRDFFRFAPHDKLEEMMRYWRVHAYADDSDQSIPNDYTKNEKESGLWWRNLVAGGVSGAVSRTCTAPLDRVRIFLQVHGTGAKHGIFGSLKNMINEGGFRSLWRGNLINVIKITPESAIKFAAYEQVKKMMGKDGAQLEPLQRFYAGTAAGWIAQSSIYPMEVLKTRLALRKTGQYSSVIDCIGKIYKNEGGIRAFYRGYVMNSIGIAGVGVNFMIYETCKNKYKQYYPENPQPSVPALIFISNISSTAAMFSTYPIFLIRTKMQSSTNPNHNIMSLARDVITRDGPRGFYRGALANLTKVLPSSCIGYLTYEFISKQLGVVQR